MTEKDEFDTANPERVGSETTFKIIINESESVESITNLFPAANWYEREVWDLFGVFFEQNDEIKRILTDYGFEGHPLS